MLDADLLLGWLRASGALLQGHFELSSGRHASDYVQCALLLEDPDRARAVGSALAAELAGHRPDSVVAPALGGVILGHEVAVDLRIPFRFTERRGGEMILGRGFRIEPGERLVVVEDVVTTGGSVRETIAVAEALGGAVQAVGAILDRSAGKVSFGDLPFAALLSRDTPSWEAADCPLCREGRPVDRPGSRARQASQIRADPGAQ